MKRYIVESTHTPAECLRALDEQLEKGKEILAKFDYGCKSGVHTGYALVETNDANEARNMVPKFLRDKALVVEVGKYTPEQIKSFHAKAA